MNQFEPEVLVHAARMWTGYGEHSCPQRKDTLILDRFGADLGRRLLDKLLALKQDFYATDANLMTSRVQTMGDIAEAEFQCCHPGIPVEVSHVLAWCYTFDFK